MLSAAIPASVPKKYATVIARAVCGGRMKRERVWEGKDGEGRREEVGWEVEGVNIVRCGCFGRIVEFSMM